MAKHVVTTEFVSLSAADRSAQVKGATLTIDAPEVDVTNMLSLGWFEGLGGIKKGTLQIEFVKDDDLSALDATVFAALGSTMAFEIRLKNAAASATNPKYTGNVLVTQWTPIAGTVGAAFGGSYSWPVTGAVTRATA